MAQKTKGLDKEESQSNKSMSAPKTRGLQKEGSQSDKSMCVPNAAGVCIPRASQPPKRTSTKQEQQKQGRLKNQKSRDKEDSIQRSLTSEQQSSFNKTGEDSLQQGSSFQQQVPLTPREIPII